MYKIGRLSTSVVSLNLKKQDAISLFSLIFHKQNNFEKKKSSTKFQMKLNFT